MDTAQVIDRPGLDPDDLTPGERIRLWRLRLGLSQPELGRAAGISGKQIGRYERGLMPPPLDVAARIADRLGVSLDYLAGRKRTSRVKRKPHPQTSTQLPLMAAVRGP